MENLLPEPNIDIRTLSTENEIDIQATLHQIKDSGDVAYLLPVINLINDSKSVSIKKAGIEAARSIKSTNSKNIILPLIVNEKYLSIKKTLISLCWETEMQLTEDLPLFFKLLRDENYAVVIEAYTVILENISATNKSQLEQYKMQLDELYDSVNENIKPLIIDCIDRLLLIEEQS